MVKHGTTNIHLGKLIAFLERKARVNKAPVWKRAAELLARPTRKRVEVNLSKIPSEGVILVPGKVLSDGMGSKATVAAFSFSAKAREKISKAGGKAISIAQLVETNPAGANVLILI